MCVSIEDIGCTNHREQKKRSLSIDKVITWTNNQKITGKSEDDDKDPSTTTITITSNTRTTIQHE